MAFQMVQPLLARAHGEGPASLTMHMAILLGAAALMAVPGISPVVILLLAGAAAMLLLGVLPVARQADEEGGDYK
jgi:uncharacterized membrane protein